MVKSLSFKKIKNKLRTVEAQIVQKLKNEPHPKFAGSYKKKRVVSNVFSWKSIVHVWPETQQYL